MNKKKLVVVIASIMMILTIAIGGTLAYFTDNSQVNNVMTMGNVDIELDEAEVSKDGDKFVAGEDRVDGNTYEGVYPGAVLPKDPTVHNEGSYDAYVRAKVVVNFNQLAGLTDKVLFDGATADAELLVIADIDTANWTFVDYAIDFPSRTVTYTYNYNSVLAAGENATLFTEITIPSTLSNEDVETYGLQTIKVDVIADAIQTFGFDSAEEAWAAFDA